LFTNSKKRRERGRGGKEGREGNDTSSQSAKNICKKVENESKIRVKGERAAKNQPTGKLGCICTKKKCFFFFEEGRNRYLNQSIGMKMGKGPWVSDNGRLFFFGFG